MTARKMLSMAICTAAIAGLLGCSKTSEKPPASDQSTTTAGAGGAPSGGAGSQAAPVAAHGAGAATGADQLPPGHPPTGDMAAGDAAGSPGSMQAEEASGVAATQPSGSPLTWTVPPTWTEEKPSSQMRKAQFRVPGAGGPKQDAECLVFYFGPGQGGSPESNASRWVDQFQQPDGSSSQGKSKVDLRTINGNQVMFVEVKGTFLPMAMGGAGSAEPRPGYAMVGAIVSAPAAPWFFKMTGPEKTVMANRAAFEALISSIKEGA